MPILRSGSQGPSMDADSIAIVAGQVRSFLRPASWRSTSDNWGAQHETLFLDSSADHSQVLSKTKRGILQKQDPQSDRV